MNVLNPEDKSAVRDGDEPARAPSSSGSAGAPDDSEGHGPFAPPEEIASLHEQPGPESSAAVPGVPLPHAGISPGGEAPLGVGPEAEPVAEPVDRGLAGQDLYPPATLQTEPAEVPQTGAFPGGDPDTHPGPGPGPFTSPETERYIKLEFPAESPAAPSSHPPADGWPGPEGPDPERSYPAAHAEAALLDPGEQGDEGAEGPGYVTSAAELDGAAWDDGYGAEDQESETRPDGPGAGPNWMMAFVCLWAAGTSLYEAWLVGAPAGFRRAILLTPEFGGYALLGLGLLGFACESLIWNRDRRRGLLRYGGGHLVLILAGLGLVLAGGVLLFLSRDPGRRI